MAETAPTPNRFERRRLETRAALLDAAIALFQQRGVRATKLEEICEHADVSARTFFNHFETREHLYRAIAWQRAEQMAALIEARGAERAPFDAKLLGLFDAIGAYLAERPAWREMVGEMLSLRLEGEADAQRKLGQALLGFVTAGVASGEVAARHRPDVLADLVLGGLTTALRRWCDDPGYDLEAGLGRAAEALLDLLSPRRNFA